MDWQQVQKLFGDANALPSEARAGFLDEHCRDDEVRAEVERLLGFAGESSTFLEEPAVRFGTEILEDAASSPYRVMGQEIGPYRLEALLGEGGMGAVYRASRVDDAYQKDVAIKLMHQGGKALVARFGAERQMLAQLDHPGIARLFDGGTTDEGHPYLVMELIDGERIDDYCAESSIEERLELFRQVCEAVSYAHRNLLVHRDLKPSNILVTPEGVAKLLDFGIAKSLATDAENTVTGQRAMTPAYASPEQIRGKAVTTNSDVYALGVLLFRLLTGESPYQLPDEASGFEIEQAVLDQEAPKPSGLASSFVAKRLRGDLDSIVLKALRKEPDQRYSSVDALAGDLDRYRNGLPVLARGGAWKYRTGKFVRRHRWALGSAAVVAAILSAGAIALLQQTQKAIDEGAKAQEALAVMDDAFRSFDPELVGSQSATDLMKAAAARARESSKEPLVRIQVLTTFGSALARMGEFENAGPMLSEAHALRLETNRDIGIGFYHLGELEWLRRNYSQAERKYVQALALLHEGTIDHARALRGLGIAKSHLGKLPEGKLLLDRALEEIKKFAADSDPEVLDTVWGLAWNAREQGDLAEAEFRFQQLIEVYRRLPPGPSLGRSLAEQGIVKFLQGELKAARELLNESLSILRQAIGVENTYVAEVLGKLVAVLIRLNDHSDAETAIQEILNILPDRHPGRGTALHNLAVIQTVHGNLTLARATVRKAIEVQRINFDDTHDYVTRSRCLLGKIALRTGDTSTAQHQYAVCLRGARLTGNSNLIIAANDGLKQCASNAE